MNIRHRSEKKVAKASFRLTLLYVCFFQHNALANPSLDSGLVPVQSLSFPIVDTNQNDCFDLSDTLDSCPKRDENNYGQDAQYRGLSPSYTDNENGSVTDNNSRLIWAKTVDINGDGEINVEDKLSFDEAQSYVLHLNHAGHSDWRIPTIKELYSLILFDGQDPSGLNTNGTVSIIPFIDHSVFGFNSGDMNAGERLIDSQYVSSTKYVSTTMHGDETVFGVNFIDGRIKGYGVKARNGEAKTFYVLAVRGNIDYGLNLFVDSENGTILDQATSLTWQQNDSEMAMNWPAALSYCENLTAADRSDWRLPNVKELQSIVDYSRSPATSNSPALDPLFKVSSIINENGHIDYPNYWSSTTHNNLKNSRNAAYVAFGRSMGYMGNSWLDVHGAGSQRSDPKVGNASQYPTGHGPQGDAIRIDNYVRCVADGYTEFVTSSKTVKRTGKQFTLSGSQVIGQAKHKLNESGSNELPGMGINSNSTKGRSSAGPMGDSDPFSKMDTNNDGKLSKQEVKGPLAKDFDQIDKNGDGFITQDEMPQRPSRRQ